LAPHSSGKGPTILGLDQKYRPGRFDDMIGQETLVRVLRSVVRRGRYSSAYMFSGPSGTGKTTAGRILAKAILCSDTKDGEPCGICDSCVRFANDQHFGYVEMDSASVGGKDDMVKLRDHASFDIAGGRRVILLDECHDISKAGQDALLIQVEKCPEHLTYIFCTTDPDKVNETLRNRCWEFQVSRVMPVLINGLLKKIAVGEGFEHEDAALQSIADRADGHVRNAIKALEGASFLGRITLDVVRELSRDFDSEICDIICALGVDLNKALTVSREVSSRISVTEFYGQMVNLLNDGSKLLYGYDDFPPKRKEMLEKLKTLHGYRLLEFLDYLLKRDKYIDRVGIQSDIVLLHYKFSTDSFKPQVITLERPSQTIAQESAVNSAEPQDSSEPRKADLSHANLSRLSIKDRSRVLREQRMIVTAKDSQEDLDRVPSEWPLPKEDRLGESSDNEPELSPEDFSKLLVGGRGGGK